MFDAAHAYDTIVIDDPDEQPMPIVGRVATAELTMQIQVLGQWHRRTPDLAETACGVPVRMVETPMRREVLTHRDGQLCDTCFTPHERHKATRADLEAQRAAEDDDRRWHAEIERRARAREARARRNTNGGTDR